MMRTMFLCAGLGTRLRPLTDELPKPMVPLGDRPMLSHLAESLARSGGRLCAINTHHLPETLWRYVRHTYADVEVFHEPELLGTAGGVCAAKSAFAGSPLLVWNSDILTDPDVAALSRGLARCPMTLAVQTALAGCGNVGIDASGRVVRLRTQSLGKEVAGGYYMGILAMRPDCFEFLPARGCLIGDVAMRVMREHCEGILAVPHACSWTDIGTPAAYLEANLEWLEHQPSDTQAWVHPKARVNPEIGLCRTIVGANASVDGKGVLDRVVIWPGARCSAPLADAIVTPRWGVISVSRGRAVSSESADASSRRS